ncbi:MAG: N(4)-(beta-N-acetylglucosaminyl)-L-asparaginase [Ignavibacteria bacterium]|jgi:isoaspartyl peptidase/L-asparaginase-like protein (Ntn-hydrolase superfamily)|nr:N(4)-(beta-N-acetylglucosaminyl)-L-asparaginase [Ignavibacteria bacterium]MDH7527268.1 N(4)-(beta-N-acetylglucosaminyl)-L-asparaginase [Ignavibacteria bacterium]
MNNLSRRKFILSSTILGIGFKFLNPEKLFSRNYSSQGEGTRPVVISTWDRDRKPNLKAWEILENGGNSLDAVELGVRVAEDDPENNSVGYGGLPDENGIVTLDACIMDWRGRAGAVAYLQNIKNPISVARLVMEKTKHVMLAGEGAKKFALAYGFKEENLLTEKSREAWIKWKESMSKDDNWTGNETHDTITMLAIDKYGNISGACTTSGLRWKIHGRVGDSPIVGAGLYVDNEVGAAGATGVGETIMRIVGSFLVVEKMREGMSPQEACEYVVRRLIEKNKNIMKEPYQAAFIALNKKGEIGAYSVIKGFDYVVSKNGKTEGHKSKFELDN